MRLGLFCVTVFSSSCTDQSVILQVAVGVGCEPPGWRALFFPSPSRVARVALLALCLRALV